MQGYAAEEVPDAEAAERKVSETWLVLEYCSKGSLQDALDRQATSCSNAAAQKCMCNRGGAACSLSVLAAWFIRSHARWFCSGVLALSFLQATPVKSVDGCFGQDLLP